MTDKQKATVLCKRLKELYPDAECALEYNGEPWKLLVMGMLSAQCKDSTVNEVCRPLFEEFPTPLSLAEAPLERVEEIIKKCGLFHTKAQNIKKSLKILVSDFNSVLPDEMDALLSFPGVGRKIGNLLLGDIYHKGGIVADTHCMRICGRLGFYPEGEKNPLKTEKIMDPLIEKREQSDFCHRIVMFGREYCDAKMPRCNECPIRELCTSEKKNKSEEKND